MEGDFHLSVLVGGQKARGREGTELGPQSSNIQCKLGAYIAIVLYLNPLCSLHQHVISHGQQGECWA